MAEQLVHKLKNINLFYYYLHCNQTLSKRARKNHIDHDFLVNTTCDVTTMLINFILTDQHEWTRHKQVSWCSVTDLMSALDKNKLLFIEIFSPIGLDHVFTIIKIETDKYFLVESYINHYDVRVIEMNFCRMKEHLLSYIKFITNPCPLLWKNITNAIKDVSIGIYTLSAFTPEKEIDFDVIAKIDEGINKMLHDTIVTLKKYHKNRRFMNIIAKKGNCRQARKSAMRRTYAYLHHRFKKI